MLDTLKIDEFRCFKHVEVPMRPLTVLVGPNDSGKSSFLQALYMFGNREPIKYPHDFWGHDRNAKPLITSVIAGKPVGLIGALTSKLTSSGPFDQLQSELQPTSFFQLPVQGVSMQSKGYQDDQGAGTIQTDGSGVPSLLDYLLRRDRKRFDAVIDSMKRLVPGLADLQVGSPDPSTRRLDLVTQQGLRIASDRASAGVRLLLFFVALAHHPTPPKLILVEEPETGVHPKRLGDVMALLRSITQGEFAGHAAQVVMTTHSPYLLDLVDLTIDQVLVFRRNDDGSRTAEPADAERLKVFLDEFMLGEVWYNQGEEGLVARRS